MGKREKYRMAIPKTGKYPTIGYHESMDIYAVCSLGFSIPYNENVQLLPFAFYFLYFSRNLAQSIRRFESEERLGLGSPLRPGWPVQDDVRRITTEVPEEIRFEWTRVSACEKPTISKSGQTDPNLGRKAAKCI